MTTHSHDRAAHGRTATPAARPRWLLPGLLAAIVAGGLVVAGVLSLSTVLYAGMFGGMLLMHLGGHGGHGGHDGPGGGASPDPANLATPASAPQLRQSGSEDELDNRAPTEESGSETQDHDKRSSHGCH